MKITSLSCLSVYNATALRGGYCDIAIWKQLEGTLLGDQDGNVVGKLHSSREARFNADGVEIQIEFQGDSYHISPRNLGEYTVRYLINFTGFTDDLSKTVLDYERRVAHETVKHRLAASTKDWLATLHKCLKKTALPAPSVSKIDCTLSLCWGSQIISNEAYSPLDVVSKLGRTEATRLLSARIAELAAIKYYVQFKKTVVDISSTQIQNGDDWRDFDLLVDGQPIDIKNARKNFTGANTYSEHCVPRFKVSRSTQKEVAIAGVFSDYVDEHRIGTRDGGYCLILGEVRKSSIEHLKTWIAQRFNSVLDISNLWIQSYQPGWVFEYPPEQYQDLGNTKHQIGKQLNEYVACGGKLEEIPGILLSLSDDEALASSLSKPGLQRKILGDLVIPPFLAAVRSRAD